MAVSGGSIQGACRSLLRRTAATKSSSSAGTGRRMRVAAGTQSTMPRRNAAVNPGPGPVRADGDGGRPEPLDLAEMGHQVVQRPVGAARHTRLGWRDGGSGAQRGRPVFDQLIATAHRAFRAQGATEVPEYRIFVPMAGAFDRAGYVNYGIRLVLSSEGWPRSPESVAGPS